MVYNTTGTLGLQKYNTAEKKKSTYLNILNQGQ